MNKLIKHAKKTFCLITCGISFFAVQPCYADSDAILAQIRDITNSILIKINTFPTYLDPLKKMAESWIETKDPNKFIANNQASFTKLNNQFSNLNQQQLSLSQTLTKDFTTAGGADLPSNINELNYGILQGQLIAPPQSGTPQPNVDTLAQNYLRYTAGTNFSMKPASQYWKPSDEKKQYQQLFNTAVSIASYNAYILSSLYKSQEQDSTRAKLVEQATSEEWFTQVATEDLGLVLRQMLMFTSQIYVDFDRSLKIQQQQLTAQAMTNTLLVIFASAQAGQMLYQKAASVR